MKRPSSWRPVVLLLFAALAVAAPFVLPVRAGMDHLLEAARNLGPWGPATLAVAYVPATVLMVPGSLLTLGAGFLFGVAVGTVAMSFGSTAGAASAFLVGRYLAREWVERRLADRPRFRALDQAVSARGFRIVFLTRLSPAFPFTVLNYAFGLTSVRFRDYLLASWLGMLPGTVLYVYLGSAARNVAELAAGGSTDNTARNGLFFVGLAATAAVTIYVTRLARRALATAAPVAGDQAAPRLDHTTAASGAVSDDAPNHLA